MNIVTLTGRIATNLDSSVVNDTTLVKFRVAVPRRGKKDEVDFFSVVVWGKQAEACAKYLSSGRKVAINGRLSQNSWTVGEGENASKRERVEIVASEVEFLDHAPKQAEAAPAAPAEPVAEPATPTVPPAVDAAANIWNPGASGAFQLFTPPATA